MPPVAVSPMDERGSNVSGSRSTKSKTPCPVGFIPVMNVDQATGLCGGVVVARRLNSPSCRRRFRFGRSAQCLSRKPGSMPSIPRTTIRFPCALDNTFSVWHDISANAARMQMAADKYRLNRKTAVALFRRLTAAKRLHVGLADIDTQRLAFHPARRLQSEQTQRGRGHVFDSRIIGLYSAIAEEDARHQHWIYTMVAAPGLAIILKDVCGDLPHGGIPRRSIPIVVSDNQVGCFRGVRTFVKIACRIDGSDADFVAFVVEEVCQSPNEFPF